MRPVRVSTSASFWWGPKPYCLIRGLSSTAQQSTIKAVRQQVRPWSGGERPTASLPQVVVVRTSSRGYSSHSQRPKAFPIARLIKESVVVGLVAGLSFFIWSNLEDVPYTNRRRLKVLLSDMEEIWLGRAYLSTREPTKSLKDVAVFSAKERAIQTLLENRFKYLKRAGDPLHLPYLEWDIQVVVDPQVKALTTPGGKILISTGLINMITELYDEGKLADPIKALDAVVALQMAHGILRHVTERRLWTMMVRFLERLPIEIASLPDLTRQLVEMPFSRDQVEEADWVAMVILARACEDPSYVPRILHLLGETDWAKIKARLSHHRSPPSMYHGSKLSQVIQDWTPNYCMSKKATKVTFSRFPKAATSANAGDGGDAKTEVRRSGQWYSWLKEIGAAKKAARKA